MTAKKLVRKQPKYRKLTKDEVLEFGIRETYGPLVNFVKENFPTTAFQATLYFHYVYNEAKLEPCHLVVIDKDGKELPINDVSNRDKIHLIDIEPDDYDDDYPEDYDNHKIVVSIKSIPDLYVLE